jgi:hypothetical protein
MTRPQLAIAALSADAPPAETMRAFAETVVTLKGAMLQREKALAACVKPQ